jgi:(1->4)-alpha-D-glucan 1-alpha-D-glucosylmutase
MRDLTATYRLQFRNGMTFDRAIQLVPYLKRLGISHLYASPIFAATSGSTHGYDVIDHNAIEPAIGGREGFERLAVTLAGVGLGLILDIVPNHMAASLENPWWRSVVEWGERSPYAHHFDIDWPEPLTLPVLGKTFAKAAEAGEISVAADPHLGTLGLRYFEQLFPLSPNTYAAALDRVDHPPAGRMVAAAQAAAPDSADEFHANLKTLLKSDEAAGLDAAFQALSRNPNILAEIHATQPWRLMFWQDARKHLSYRRFFEVTGLVGVRVEDERVFDDVHRLILELVRSGKVQGLRVDHVDGLADPTNYLRRLRDAVGPDVTLHVEKIVEEIEHLPAWPIEGTTGYEFIGSMADVFSKPEGKAALDAALGRMRGEPIDIEAERRAAKRGMVEENFATELNGLVRLAEAALGPAGMPFNEEAVRSGITAIVIAFPVYRTYGNTDDLSAEDRAIIEEAAAKARLDDPGVTVDRIAALLLDLPNAEAREFRTRFQQLTGPIMAKAVEDTLFYRANGLIALNEVGGDPSRAGAPIAVFHDAMAERHKRQPHGLTATSTHDTKRGEDARARLYTLSETPEIWSAAVERWRSMHRRMIADLPGGSAPEPDAEWLLYQALAGVVPEDLDIGDEAALSSLAERYLAFVEKALREAKRRTDWVAVDPAYERAVMHYARQLLSPGNRAFLADFQATLRPFAHAGRVNSLAQTMLKLTVPGVPDIYQGSEAADFSLVDPDNRREPDFAELQKLLDGEAGTAHSSLAAQKLQLVSTCLKVRQRLPKLFGRGDYQPLCMSGPKTENIVAFVRRAEGTAVLVAVPRFVFGAPLDANGSINPDWFGETTIILDQPLAQTAWHSAFTGKQYAPVSELAVSELFAGGPVAMLLAES